MSKVRILPYSKDFPRKFERIKNRILKIIRKQVDIHHIGSTAVENLAGKGVIDILIGVENWKEGKEVVRSLQHIGFVQGTAPRGRIFLSFKKGMKDTHIHIVRKNTKQYRDFLNFRDYLRIYPNERKRYVELKKKLYPLIKNKEKYKELKEQYIKSILRRIK